MSTRTQGIAIAADCLRDEAENVREGHAGGKSDFQQKNVLLLIKAVLVATAARRFDGDRQQFRARLGGAGGAFFGFVSRG